MKRKVGIWLDSSKAIIVSFEGKEHTIEEIDSSVENRVHHEAEGDKGVMSGTQAINREKIYDERRMHQFKDFYDRIIDRINMLDVAELYLFGPGLVKTHLKKAIGSENSLSGISVTEETADSMTNNQVVHQVKAKFSIK